VVLFRGRGSSRLSYFAGKGGSLQPSTIYVSCSVPLRIRCTLELYICTVCTFMQFKLNLLPPLTAAAMIHSAFFNTTIIIGSKFNSVFATSHTRLKANDHCNLSKSSRWTKGGDCSSSHHTRRWTPEGPKKTSWMKSLRGVLHGGLWIRYHGLLKFASGPSSRGGPDANSGDRDFFFFFQQDIFQVKLHGIFHNSSRTDKHRQVILLNW
jgi:hypothetical protein